MVLALLECLIFQSEPNNPIQDLDTWRMLDEYLGIPSKRETFLSKVLYIFRRLLQTAIQHIHTIRYMYYFFLNISSYTFHVYSSMAYAKGIVDIS